MSELKPCPFCGGEAQRFTLPEDEFGNGGGDVITCSRCQASSHVEFGRKENLVDRWNHRATEAELLDALELAVPDDVRAVLDVLQECRAEPAVQVAADASFESGKAITPERVSRIRKALHTLGLVDFGSLHDEDSERVCGRGYWLNRNGAKLRALITKHRGEAK